MWGSGDFPSKKDKNICRHHRFIIRAPYSLNAFNKTLYLTLICYTFLLLEWVMATEKRIKILSEAEIDELYSAPIFNECDQRFFFTLNDAESDACRRIRSRQHKCMFVLLLGYFKSKPVLIVP